MFLFFKGLTDINANIHLRLQKQVSGKYQFGSFSLTNIKMRQNYFA